MLRMAKNESRLLAINNTVATAVKLSTVVTSERCRALMEVSTIKQRPNKVADVLRMCGDLLAWWLIMVVVTGL